MSEIPNQKSKIALKEEEILNFWKENKIFEKTLAKESARQSSPSEKKMASSNLCLISCDE